MIPLLAALAAVAPPAPIPYADRERVVSDVRAAAAAAAAPPAGPTPREPFFVGVVSVENAARAIAKQYGPAAAPTLADRARGAGVPAVERLLAAAALAALAADAGASAALAAVLDSPRGGELLVALSVAPRTDAERILLQRAGGTAPAHLEPYLLLAAVAGPAGEDALRKAAAARNRTAPFRASLLTLADRVAAREALPADERTARADADVRFAQAVASQPPLHAESAAYRAAARMLSRHGVRLPVALLRERIESPVAAERAVAAALLGFQKEADAVRTLRTLAGGTDVVASVALAALADVGTPNAVRAIETLVVADNGRHLHQALPLLALSGLADAETTKFLRACEQREDLTPTQKEAVRGYLRVIETNLAAKP